MEGNKDVLLPGDDAIGYLTWPMYKKYSMKFISGHSFSTCRPYERFFYYFHIPPCAHMYAFRVPPPFVYMI